MELKPQDTLLALKYWSIESQKQENNSVRAISDLIGISASEVSKASRRLIAAHLAVERSGRLYVESGALLEWLSFGVRYAYPQVSVGYGRGMPTSWNCPFLNSEIVPPSPAMVWPAAGGARDGILIKPVHDSVPLAASKDEHLYRAFSLLEAIRGGKPRELTIARKLLNEMIKDK